MANNKCKWFRDPDATGEPYSVWYKGDPADEGRTSDASIHPEWSACRAVGQGRPDSFVAYVLGVKIGSWRTIREATRACDLELQALAANAARLAGEP